MIAIERGLEPLAELMMTLSDKELETRAAEFVSEEKGVASVERCDSGRDGYHRRTGGSGYGQPENDP